MDKNKNRTDLLAAGRKKLQQYRQKKDGKGSKSSGKSNKPDPDVVADEASSVAKPTKGKKQLPDDNLQNSNADLATNADVTTPDLSSASNLPIEVSEADESIKSSAADEVLESSDLNDSSETVKIEGKPESEYVHVTPVGLKTILDDHFSQKAGELNAARGEDQVPDVGAIQEDDHSCSEPDNKTHLIDLDGDMNPGSSTFNEKVQVNSEVLEDDNKTEYTDSATEQTGEHDGDNSGANNADSNSSSGFKPKDVVAGFHDAEVNSVDLTQLAKMFQLLNEDEFRFVMAERAAISGRDLKIDGGDLKSDSVFFERLREQLFINHFEKELIFLLLCEELDVQKKFENEKSSNRASFGDLEVKNKIMSDELAKCRYELDRVAHEMEKIQTELDRSEQQLSNVSTELVDCRSLLSDLEVKNEDLNVNVVSLTEVKHQLEKEKGDRISENVKLMNELMEAKSLMELSEVERVNTSDRIEKLQIELDRSEHQLSNVMSELLDLQAKNEDLNGNVASLTEVKHELEKEKEDRILEIEKLMNELMEVKSLVELSQVEKVNSSDLIEKLQLELERSEHQLSNLQVQIEDLNEHVASLTEVKDKLEKEKEDGVLENEKLMNELMEVKSLLELSQIEKVNSSDCIEKLQIELDGSVNQLSTVSSELVNSRSLLSDLQAKNEDLNVNVASLTEVKHKLEKEKGDGILENEKLKNELMEVKSLLELSQVEKVNSSLLSDLEAKIENLNVNVATLTEVKHKLEKEKGDGILENEKLIKELTEVKSLLELSQVEKVNSKESLAFVMEDRLLAELEETFLKHLILDEFLKQYVSTVEAQKGEFVILCEDLRQEVFITKNKNTELTEELFKSESRIHELQDMTEKIKDLEGRNELAAYVIHKVFDNLQKIVNDSNPSTENEDDTTGEQLDHLEISNYDVFIERLIMILRERAQLEIKNREYNLELLRKMKDMEALNKRCINPDVILSLFEDIQCVVTLHGIEIKPDEPVSTLNSIIQFFINEMKLMSNQIDYLTFSIVPYEIESQVLKETLKNAIEQIATIQSEKHLKETELNQSEQRVSALREKLHIAVTKGKGLIQQRDSLKQNLSLKEATIQEIETKLKNYSEAGERMEALESELSYIRNSATALRESFLLKDSVLQRIEEILEDLDLPEHFHVKDIIDKIDWLAKSVSQNSFPVINSNQTSSIPRTRSYPDTGSGVMGGWKEVLEPSLGQNDDELRRNYEELQNKFYELAEQNEMLEQSLMEQNNLVQRCEEVLEKTNMPLQFRSLEPEDRIEWLRVALLEANNRCDSLQEDVYELEKIRESLAADLEESQRRLVDVESTLRSITDEREQLSASLEVQSHDYNKICEKAALLAAENDKLQTEVGALQSRLDEKAALTHGQRSVDQSDTCGEFDLAVLERKLEKVEGDLVRVKDERDRLVEKSQSLVNEVEALEVKNQELMKLKDERDRHVENSQSLVNEVEALQVKIQELQILKDERDKLVEKSQYLVNEVEALKVKNQELEKLKDERDRLVEKIQSLVNEIESLEVNNQELEKFKDERDIHMEKNQSLINEIKALEVKIHELEKLKDERDRLVEKSQSLVSEIESIEVKNQELEKFKDERDIHVEKNRSLSNEIKALKVKIQELEKLKDERDSYVEKSQSLVNEVEALELKNQELQKLLSQEEQKTASVKEKLNVAVRKGKSLVQVRDSMKHNINDLTSQVDRLTSEIKVRENTLLEYQQKIKHLVTSQEMVENKDSEIRFLKNRLEESHSELQDNRNTLSMILGHLGEIDLGFELKFNDPFEKLNQIEKVFQDLQQDSRKSKKAAELLLEELNEVQERNEDLLEEISKTTMEISELSKERSSQFSELMKLKSGFDQLRPGFSQIYRLINDILPKDLDNLYNVEESVKSLLESSDNSNVSGQTLNSSHGGVSSRSDSKVNVHYSLFLDNKTEDVHTDNNIIDLWRFVGTHMQDLMTNIKYFEEKLQSHSKCLHEEVVFLSEKMTTLSSHRYSLESVKKKKETENLMLHKYISMLYEACKHSVSEIEKIKGKLVAIDYSEETLSVNEECITSMVNKLLSTVKDFHNIQAENVEVNLKEMKDMISSLQKEVNEKDVQKDRMSVEFVSQIKRAEAAAMNHLQELEHAKVQINELKGQLETVNVDRSVLEQKVKELEGQELTLVDLNGKVKSLTDALIAKEQEAEALLQALDEEEAQMEDLTNKITELERLVQQKNLDLEAAETARNKSLKKLSVTVNKFDELHHLSETLVSEVDNLQSQLQERDSEISFLRDEITRCTSDSLQALETDKRGLTEIQDILTWLNSMVFGVETLDFDLDENKIDQIHEYKEILKKQITSIVSELKDLRQMVQNKDDLLHIEKSKVDDLMHRREILENSLREKESRLSLHENDGDSAQGTSMVSEIVEVEPVINKWPLQGSSMASQVRSLRKVNNDQLAISIDDMDSDDRDKLEDDDDDKAHGFKSLTTSTLVPRFTRPVTDFIDGLWVSCDRTLMRQPLLRLSIIFYWAVMHALLAVFVV